MNLKLHSPGGERAWIALLVLLGGASLLGVGIVQSIVPLLPVSAGVLVLASGLWLRHQWARWLGAAVFATYSIWFIWNLALNGFAFYPALAVFCCGYFAWRIWKIFAPEPPPAAAPSEPG